jgi:hypothetical protein
VTEHRQNGMAPEMEILARPARRTAGEATTAAARLT